MSVINTMLKDLERRGVDPASSNDNVLGGLSANSGYVISDDDRTNPYLIGLLITLILFIIVTVVYFVSPYKLIAEDHVVVVESSSNTSAAIAVNTQPIKPQTKSATDTVTNALQTNNAVEKTMKSKASIETQAVISMPADLTNREKLTKVKPVVTKPVTKVQKVTVKPVEVKPVVTKQNNPVKKVITENTIVEAIEAEDRIAAEETQTINKKQLPVTDEEKSQQLYTSARKLYNKGSKRRSKALLQEALGLSVDNVEAYRLLTVLYLEEGRSDLATEIMEQGLAENGNDQELLRLYLQTLVQEGKYKSAITIMEKRLRLTTPDDIGYLAGLYQKDNEHRKAVTFYSRALQLKPNKSIWWMGQGISFEIMKQYQPALKSYQQSISTGQLSTTLSDYVFNKIKAIKQFAADSVS